MLSTAPGQCVDVRRFAAGSHVKFLVGPAPSMGFLGAGHVQGVGFLGVLDPDSLVQALDTLCWAGSAACVLKAVGYL